MNSARGCFGLIAMILFGSSIVFGWGFLLIIPLLLNGAPTAGFNAGWLLFVSAGSLIVWRVAGGPGWGFSDDGAEKASSPEERRYPNEAITRSTQGSLPVDWAEALAAKGFDDGQMRELISRAYVRPGGEVVLPPRGMIFRAFHVTPLEEVKVVILGMDPYSRRGRADGLAFSVSSDQAIPQSLKRIFANLESDPELNFDAPRSGDLSGWAESGVLLLNAALTVKEGDSGSDFGIWRDFTLAVLGVVEEECDPSVLMFWGDDANRVADKAAIGNNHLVLRSTHPRRESSSKFARFADTRQFSEANLFLSMNGRSPVDWDL